MTNLEYLNSLAESDPGALAAWFSAEWTGANDDSGAENGVRAGEAAVTTPACGYEIDDLEARVYWLEKRMAIIAEVAR